MDSEKDAIIKLPSQEYIVLHAVSSVHPGTTYCASPYLYNKPFSKASMKCRLPHYQLSGRVSQKLRKKSKEVCLAKLSALVYGLDLKQQILRSHCTKPPPHSVVSYTFHTLGTTLFRTVSIRKLPMLQRPSRCGLSRFPRPRRWI